MKQHEAHKPHFSQLYGAWHEHVGDATRSGVRVPKSQTSKGGNALTHRSVQLAAGSLDIITSVVSACTLQMRTRQPQDLPEVTQQVQSTARTRTWFPTSPATISALIACIHEAGGLRSTVGPLEGQ